MYFFNISGFFYSVLYLENVFMLLHVAVIWLFLLLYNSAFYKYTKIQLYPFFINGHL